MGYSLNCPKALGKLKDELTLCEEILPRPSVPFKEMSKAAITFEQKKKTLAIGRGLQKHACREWDFAYKCEITGNNMKNTEHGLALLEELFERPDTVFYIRNHSVHGKVLDIRLDGGGGARWTVDGKEFIGLL
jgi:hypothetical protein